MQTIELIDASAAEALAQAAVLQERLRLSGSAGESWVEQCRDDMHRLVADIVSLRNAAELLKREVDAKRSRLPGTQRRTNGRWHGQASEEQLGMFGLTRCC